MAMVVAAGCRPARTRGHAIPMRRAGAEAAHRLACIPSWRARWPSARWVSGTGVTLAAPVVLAPSPPARPTVSSPYISVLDFTTMRGVPGAVATARDGHTSADGRGGGALTSPSSAACAGDPPGQAVIPAWAEEDVAEFNRFVAAHAAPDAANSKSMAALTPSDRAALIDALRPLYSSEEVMDLANRYLCVGDQLYPRVIARLRRRLVTMPGPLFDDDMATFQQYVRSSSAAVRSPHPAHRILFFRHAVLPRLARVAAEDFGDTLSVARLLRQRADLRYPHTWYPLARRMRRRVVFHAGPTNSGKTFHALRALKDAHSGIYCGPLRLLALEVYESMNLDGVPACLLTGQERRDIPFATHTSCTVEMVDVSRPVDVAVIDEIQMIGDKHRGSAWTRALLGVCAPEVHVCGDPAALPVVTSLVNLCGDELVVQNYARMTPLQSLNTSLGADYGRVEEGDCIVAFSRKDVYAIRKVIERKTAHRCCVVYGSLPPETRSQQARLFNDPASGFRVLVASDAIGMGLNLNIRRVIFHTMDKFDGDNLGPVPPPQVKQIAGRAGRRNSIYPQGFSTTLQDADLPYLQECLVAPSPPITHAGLFPNAEQLIKFQELLPPGTPFADVIESFVSASHLEGPYFMCRDNQIRTIAQLLDSFPLAPQQRASLCLAPVNMRSDEVREWFLAYLRRYTAGEEVRLNMQLPYSDPTYLIRDLEHLEEKIQALDVYMWLSQRLGVWGFPDTHLASVKRGEAAALLEAALNTLSDETKSDWERVLARRQASYASTGDTARKRARVLAASRGDRPPPTTPSLDSAIPIRVTPSLMPVTASAVNGGHAGVAAAR